MNNTRFFFGLLLLGLFAALVWMGQETGWLGWIEPAFATRANVFAALDIMTALSIGVGWMWIDARRRGTNPLPYAVPTFLLSSFGPLTCLFNRAGQARN